jgi:hypothetical protein
MTFYELKSEQPFIAETLVQRYVLGTINREREAGQVEEWLERYWQFEIERDGSYSAGFDDGCQGCEGNYWDSKTQRWYIGEEGEFPE